MLPVESHIHIELQAVLVVLLKFRHNANYLPIVVVASCASPVILVQFDIVERQVKRVDRLILTLGEGNLLLFVSLISHREIGFAASHRGLVGVVQFLNGLLRFGILLTHTHSSFGSVSRYGTFRLEPNGQVHEVLSCSFIDIDKKSEFCAALD